MYTLRYSKQAIKALRRMPKGVSGRILDELDELAANPRGYRGDWKQVRGTEFWRLRVGGWRAVCEIKNNDLVIYVLKIGPRGDVYK